MSAKGHERGHELTPLRSAATLTPAQQ